MDYVITGVWFSNTPNHSKHISDVLLHKYEDGTIYEGIKTTVSSVVSLIEHKNNVFTMKWNYLTASFQRGALVEIEQVGFNKYLRTKANSEKSDNLENMINMIIIC
jgi:hypothetical protein